jgi:hypothetical protein
MEYCHIMNISYIPSGHTPETWVIYRSKFTIFIGLYFWHWSWVVYDIVLPPARWDFDPHDSLLISHSYGKCTIDKSFIQ